MARLASAGAVLLVAVAAACGGSAPTQPEAQGKVEKAPRQVSTHVVCTPSNIQIRQVFAGAARWVTSLGSGDKTWDRDDDSMFCSGDYYFEDYMLIVPPGKTTSVELWGGNDSDGSCSRSKTGKLGDPYIYVFDFDTKQITEDAIDDEGEPDDGYDDDSGCGYNSYLAIRNLGTTGKRYIIRLTTYDEFETGLGQLVIRTPDQGPSLNKPLW